MTIHRTCLICPNSRSPNRAPRQWYFRKCLVEFESYLKTSGRCSCWNHCYWGSRCSARHHWRRLPNWCWSSQHWYSRNNRNRWLQEQSIKTCEFYLEEKAGQLEHTDVFVHIRKNGIFSCSDPRFNRGIARRCLQNPTLAPIYVDVENCNIGYWIFNWRGRSSQECRVGCCSSGCGCGSRHRGSYKIRYISALQEPRDTQAHEALLVAVEAD